MPLLTCASLRAVKLRVVKRGDGASRQWLVATCWHRPGCGKCNLLRSERHRVRPDEMHVATVASPGEAGCAAPAAGLGPQESCLGVTTWTPPPCCRGGHGASPAGRPGGPAAHVSPTGAQHLPVTATAAKVPGTAGGGKKQGMPSHWWWQRGCGHARAWGGPPPSPPGNVPAAAQKKSLASQKR